MTAYCSNLPWSAAAGGELGGGRGGVPGFARVPIHPNGGTGLEYRGTIEKLYMVRVQCDCGMEYELGRANWCAKSRAPQRCTRCAQPARSAGAAAARMRSFTKKGHQLARDYTVERKATRT